MPSPAFHQKMPAPDTRNKKESLVYACNLIALIIVVAACSTFTILHALHKQAKQQAEQQNTQFQSIIIMIVISAVGILYSSATRPCACVHCQRN